jgi:hypothetical protein
LTPKIRKMTLLVGSKEKACPARRNHQNPGRVFLFVKQPFNEGFRLNSLDFSSPLYKYNMALMSHLHHNHFNLFY